jgi:hypothetical protein
MTQSSAESSVPSSPKSDIKPAMPKTVLIVEDNELNMKLFRDLLEAHGYATLQTERIREGGCEAYISKPITVSMFLETIRQFVGRTE